MSSKTLFAFNKYFYEFLKEVKSKCKGDSESTLYSELKSKYTVKDNETTVHIDAFIASCNEEIKQQIITDVKQLDQLETLVIIEGYIVKDILAYCSDFVHKYILIFTYLSLVYQHHGEHEDKLIHCLAECQNHKKIDDVVDDDLSAILKQINEDGGGCGDDDEEVIGDQQKGSFEEMLGNSSIGSLAKEIASSINIDELNINSPEDIFKGDNSKLIGDIVSKVTSNISQKMSNGSINQDAMMSEAMNLMGSMGNNPMMQNLMKMMGGPHNNSKARDRLSKKFAQKSAKQQ